MLGKDLPRRLSPAPGRAVSTPQRNTRPGKVRPTDISFGTALTKRLETLVQIPGSLVLEHRSSIIETGYIGALAPAGERVG